MQENSDFFAIFGIMDARVARYETPYRLLGKGGKYPNNIRDN